MKPNLLPLGPPAHHGISVTADRGGAEYREQDSILVQAQVKIQKYTKFFGRRLTSTKPNEEPICLSLLSNLEPNDANYANAKASDEGKQN